MKHFNPSPPGRGWREKLKNDDMKEINLPPFYVGQKVVCVKSHSLGGVCQGKEYIIGGTKFLCCQWVVDVGQKTYAFADKCKCGTLIFDRLDDTAWYSAELFAPIQENFETISYEKVRELESPLINAN